jgi:hypothetical protein
MTVEIGAIGMLLMLGLWLRVLLDGARLVRRLDDGPERYLVAALVSLVAALAAAWFVGPVTVSSPTAPMFWVAVGCLAWMGSRPRPEVDRRVR